MYLICPVTMENSDYHRVWSCSFCAVHGLQVNAECWAASYGPSLRPLLVIDVYFQVMACH